MKNNKFVSLSDFKNTLVINGFNGEMIEKAEHKVHKYLRKEGGKYIYDYDKMNVKEHEDASWEHHVQHIVNDTKAEGRKMAKDKELEEHYRKHAAYHKEEKEKHTKLAEEKSGNQMSEKDFNNKFDIKYNNKKDTGHIANIVQATDKQTKEMHTYYEDQGRKGFEYYRGDNYGGKGKSYSRNYQEGAEPSKNKAIYEHLKRLHSEYYNKKDKSDLKKSEAFDILIGDNFEDKLEKSKGPWKKGKQHHQEAKKESTKLSPKTGEMVGFKKFDTIYKHYDEKDLHESEKKNFGNKPMRSVFLDEDKNSVALILESEYSHILPKDYKEKIKNITLKQISDGTWLTGDSKVDEILDEAIIVLDKTKDGLQTTQGYKMHLSKNV